MARLLLILVSALLAAATVSTAASPARATAGAWAEADMVEARLVSAVDGTGELGRVPLGLHVRLEPGWKTYWRSPGDAGLPPTLDWAGSSNLASADMAWPAPHRFTLFGLETFGYEREVVFPIEAVPAEPGRPLALRVAADLLVCADICVPQRLDLRLDLPAGLAVPGGDAQLVNRFRSQVPGDGAASGLSVERVAATAGGIVVSARAREPFVEPDAFVEAGDGLAFAAPRATFSPDGHGVTLDLPFAGQVPGQGEIAGEPVTVTLVDGDRSVEASTTVSAVAGGAGGGTDGGTDGGTAAGLVDGGLAAMLGLAVLGGLLLNVMPCVLPVLSLKLLSVAGQGGERPGRVRAGFLASAAGILFSFLLLASALIGLKQAGAVIGWGIQFQQPVFLVLMVVLLTLFAANLWGLFEIALPRALADVAAGDPASAPQPTLGGHFATGAFATLLATPCSAPFLGTAVGFALARGPGEILAVFTALGIGLALPYLAVAALPGLARLLPRPGRWMIVLRRVLGVALALTGVWLLSVLAVQVSANAAWAVAAAMAAVVLVLAVRRRLPAGPRLAGGAVAAVLAVAALGLPAAFDRPASAAGVEPAGSRWTGFDRGAIREAVTRGRTVFVDVTADWCITCKANKSLVIDRGEVARRLSGDGIVAMRADWTRPDPAISDYLAGYGRYGIPFNIVYGPGAPEGIALPELLTEGAVLDALDRAAAGPVS